MSRGSAHFRRPTQGFSSSLWKSPVSSRSSSTSSMPSSHPRHQILVIGAGRMGTIRAAAFYGSRTSTLAGIVDADEAKAAELGRQYHAPAFSNLSTALRALPDVRAVWICTPTPLHTESIKEAMEAGLAVGIEKPVAIQTDDIRLCYQWAAEKNVPLYCSFQRRIDPSYVQLLQTVKEGKIADIRSVRAVFRDHPVPSLEFLRLGGDIFHDLVVGAPRGGENGEGKLMGAE